MINICRVIYYYIDQRLELRTLGSNTRGALYITKNKVTGPFDAPHILTYLAKTVCNIAKYNGNPWANTHMFLANATIRHNQQALFCFMDTSVHWYYSSNNTLLPPRKLVSTIQCSEALVIYWLIRKVKLQVYIDVYVIVISWTIYTVSCRRVFSVYMFISLRGIRIV